jgi:hypothetical protein
VKIIAVLGMHRSGTSLCARICQDLSVYLGTNLLSGDAHNPEGYFEDRSIVASHHGVLQVLNRRGSGPETGGNGSWWEDPELEPYSQELESAILRLRREAGAENIGFKDPRTLNFLSFWKQLFEKFDLEARLVLAVRHPQAVYFSLARRNGLSQEYSEFLWLQHNLAALVEWTRPALLPIVYERWFSEPGAQLSQMAEFIGCAPAQLQKVSSRVHEIVNGELNHAPALDRGEHSERAAELYAFLLDASRAGGILNPRRDFLGACEDRMHDLGMMLNIGCPAFGFSERPATP